MIRTIVVAISENYAIGKDNDLLWKLPDDFKFFKMVTTGNYILMGRKTYESLGKPLPNRTSVVITRNKDYEMPEGHEVVHSLEDALSHCEAQGLHEAMIIGGGKIYKEAIEKKLVDRMLITEVQASFDDADAFFPKFDKSEWKEERREHHGTDEKHEYAFDFVTYVRK